MIVEETQEESQAIDPVFKQIVEEEFAIVTIISAGKPHSAFTYAKEKRKQPFVATAEKGYCELPNAKAVGLPSV